jgi:hypothetical protein
MTPADSSAILIAACTRLVRYHDYVKCAFGVDSKYECTCFGGLIDALKETIEAARAEERQALLDIAFHSCCFNADYRAIEREVRARGESTPEAIPMPPPARDHGTYAALCICPGCPTMVPGCWQAGVCLVCAAEDCDHDEPEVSAPGPIRSTRCDVCRTRSGCDCGESAPEPDHAEMCSSNDPSCLYQAACNCHLASAIPEPALQHPFVPCPDDCYEFLRTGQRENCCHHRRNPTASICFEPAEAHPAIPEPKPLTPREAEIVQCGRTKGKCTCGFHITPVDDDWCHTASEPERCKERDIEDRFRYCNQPMPKGVCPDHPSSTPSEGK